MTQTHMAMVMMAPQLLISLIAYQYLTHRTEENRSIKSWVQFKLDYPSLLTMIVAFFLAAYVFLRGYLLEGDSFMRAMMNTEVMLWLSVLGYIDAREKIIPNSMIVLGLAFWAILVMLEIFLGGTEWLQLLVFSGIGGLVCGGVLFVLAIMLKSALGMGDVKMFFVLGLLYGLTDTYGILLFSVIILGIVSIVLLLAKKVTKKTAIPMAPFVAIGFFLSILAGM